MSSGPWKWIETDWSVDDLQDRSVAFRITTESGEAFGGKGHFDVSDRPSIDNLKRIEIVVNTFDGPKATTTRFYMPQQSADKIVKSPAGSNTEFSLLLW